jgi:hypothetical protein
MTNTTLETLTTTTPIQPIEITPAPSNPWQPLTHEEKLLVIAELDSLQKDTLQTNIIQNWDSKYKILFNAIQVRLAVLAERLGCLTPCFYLHFGGGWNHNAAATIQRDYSKAMHIGVDFLRTYLLCPEEENNQKNHAVFMWIIAHELGHLHDTLFFSYGKRPFLFSSAPSVFFMILGLTALDTLSLFEKAILYPVAICLGTITHILLRRHFEYNADKFAIGIVDEFDPEHLANALSEMSKLSVAEGLKAQDALLASITETTPGFMGLVKWVFTKGSLWYQNMIVREFHPPIHRRIARIIKLARKK